ncbi:MAG TPA: T9SS type A sorting domain-containing protein [Ignavibacteria bacterium]
MKKFFLLIFLVLSIQAMSQYSWNKYTFTSGFVDKNPSFALKYRTSNVNLFYWEFLIFERYFGSNSQICVLKIGQNGPVDTVRYLTNTSSQKRNPAISYSSRYQYPGIQVPYALAIWEEYQNGRWNLNASSYDSLSGWGQPYPFDTSVVNKSNVKIISNDSALFTIVYEKNNDIIFRQFNTQTHLITLDTNLTVNEPANCGNPLVVFGVFGLGTNFVVAYEKLKSDNKKAIYYTIKLGINTWSAPDTVAYIGDNIINEFDGDGFLRPELVFQSDRNGKYKFYSTVIYPSGQNYQSAVFYNLSSPYNYFYFRSFFYPIITDYSAFQACSYLRKSDSSKLFCGSNFGFNDSTSLGDSLINIKPSINRGIKSGGAGIVWVAFTKDSLSLSNIYAKRTLVALTNINKIGNSIPGEYKLFQNYPNPFNPVTKIKFDVAEHTPNPLSRGENVSLKIYDITGREIQTLVNEKLNSGTYEVTFDGSNYASGVYFYKLRSGEFVETKKLVLLK